MKAMAIILSLLLITSLFLVACNRQEDTKDTTQPSGQQTAEPETETAQYIEGQLISPEETVEIGEMI